MNRIVLLSLLALLHTGCSHSEGVSKLMASAKQGDLGNVESLIKEGSDVNQRSRYGWTALMFASWQGHREVVEYLLEHGADPNVMSKHVPSSFETTADYPPTNALAESLSNGHTDIARLLMSRAAGIDMLSVAMAGKAGDRKILAEMRRRGADFNQYSNNEFHPSALCAAIAEGDLETTSWLCENGAKINVILGHFLPLMTAIGKRHPEIVAYLLEHGADPNLCIGDPGYHHNYPLGAAAMASSNKEMESAKLLRIVRLLLEHDAVATVRDNGGDLILDNKLTQRENARKYEAEYRQGTTQETVLERLRKSARHDDAVIRLLQKAMGRTPGN